MKRTGRLRERLAVFAMRSVGLFALRLAQRLGLNAGATEGPPVATDPAARATFDELVASARAGDGTIEVGSCIYPVHELLTYLVSERNYLLHGSNDPGIRVLEPRPARDLGTELHAVVACDDGIWPLFYAVVSRERIEAMFTNCPRRPSSPAAPLLHVRDRRGSRGGRDVDSGGRVRPPARRVPARVGKRVGERASRTAAPPCPRDSRRLPAARERRRAVRHP